jgi:hypothetical protein
MPKDIDETEDKVVDSGKLGEGSDPVEKETIVDDVEDKEPPSLRESISKAFKEVSEKEDADIDDSDSTKDKREEGKSAKKVSSGERSASKEHREEQRALEKTPKEPDKDTVEPPPFWKIKGRSTWDKLSPEDKKVLTAREQEVSNGFAQYSQRVKSFDELERAIAPRRQMIREFGVSEAQTVDRLFQWMENLGSQNPAHKANTFKRLAANFGIDLNQLVDSSSSENTQPNVTSNDPPEWFEQYAGQVGQEIGGLKQHIASQQQAAADNLVYSWATATDNDGTKLRPYFDEVRELMAHLSASGIVPLKNGMIDLDGAYDAATKLNPDITALIQKDASEKAAKEAKAKAEKDVQERAKRLAKARNAGSGFKSAASSMAVVTQSNARLNGAGGPKKNPSVRESIRAAIQEHSE